MNILVVTSHGMYGNYTFSFVHNQAKEYTKLGHRVRAVVPLAIAKKSNEGRRSGPLVEIVHQDGVEVCYVRHLSLGKYGARRLNAYSSKLACWLLASKILKDFKPDVIHAHTIGFGGCVGAAFKSLCKVPMVITTHGGDTNLAIEDKERNRSKRICDGADAIVTVSDGLLQKVNKLNTATNALRIFNGFKLENVCESAERIKHRIVQVGNLIPLKRNQVTIRAVEKLREQYPDVTLHIVGAGSERKSLEELCCKLNMGESVHFCGQLPNHEAMAEMAQAEFFIMPSSPEGFGIVYLEAMASGCVAIGTRGEGIADVIRDGENGFLVPVDDVDAIVAAVKMCFDDRKLLDRIALQGKTDASKLTWRRNAESYISLFNRLSRP